MNEDVTTYEVDLEGGGVIFVAASLEILFDRLYEDLDDAPIDAIFHIKVCKMSSEEFAALPEFEGF